MFSQIVHRHYQNQLALLRTVCNMLSTNGFVHVIALDFSKVFDSVRHSNINDNDNEREFIQRVVINKSRTR